MLSSAVHYQGRGHWVRTLSEASWGSVQESESGKSGQRHPLVGYLSEAEPELIRITSLESDTNSEALLRLFGRKESAGRQSAREQNEGKVIPAAHRTPSLQCVSQPFDEDFLSSLRPSDQSNSPIPSPTSTIPFFFQGRDCTASAPASPSGTADIASLCPLAESSDTYAPGPSPFSSTGEQELEGKLFRRGSTMPETARAVVENIRLMVHRESTDMVDPTCSLDPVTWASQSLQAVLMAQPVLREPCDGAEPLETEGTTESILALISDPDVKAKIRALRLLPSEPVMPDALLGRELLQVGRGRDRHGYCQQGQEQEQDDATEELCDSPQSPPPLTRRFAVKRGTALDECWLTGEQLRRKFSDIEDTCDQGATAEAMKRPRF